MKLRVNSGELGTGLVKTQLSERIALLALNITDGANMDQGFCDKVRLLCSKQRFLDPLPAWSSEIDHVKADSADCLAVHYLGPCVCDMDKLITLYRCGALIEQCSFFAPARLSMLGH